MVCPCTQARNGFYFAGTHQLKGADDQTTQGSHPQQTASMEHASHPIRPTDHGWIKTCAHHYKRDGVTMDCNMRTNTVKTTLDHPTKGHTQLIREGLSDNLLERVLDDPRTHTGCGSYISRPWTGK